MKKLILFFTILFSFSSAFAGKIDKIVFFGDSLTDNGNLYEYLLHVIPKSPPYYDGRFTNGPTWAERVGSHFYQSRYVGTQNYAVAGATAVFHMPTPKFISPATLEVEIDKYLLDHLFRNKSNTMFVLWIGGNDYIFDADKNPDEATDKVVNSISWAIKTLYDHGGRHFFVLNLPDLSKVPEVIQNGKSHQTHVLSLLHNQKLAEKIHSLKSLHQDMTVGELDINSFFNEAMDDPAEFNRRYHTAISNLTDACWKGGFWLSQPMSRDTLTQAFTKAMQEQKNTPATQADPEALADMVMNTPELSATYQLGMSYAMGNVPCADPDSYLFWDHIHPTAIVHNVLADIIIEKLTPSFN